MGNELIKQGFLQEQFISFNFEQMSNSKFCTAEALYEEITNRMKENKEASMQYLKDVYNSVVLKDVIRRNNIREVDMLDRIVSYVMANVGHIFSASSIVKYFKSENRKISCETVMNYLKMCQEAFLIYKAPREDLVGKKILSVNEKYYIADHGIKHYNIREFLLKETYI